MQGGGHNWQESSTLSLFEGIVDCAAQTARKEGVLALYQGFTLPLLPPLPP